MTHEENEMLTRVAAGTPMGELFRRYWLPALLSSEVTDADGVPVRLRILGEDLLAFRDSNGRVGIVAAYCSHRRAPLFFGRNEDCGLRCPYHGWKFDVDGNCVDMPNAGGGRDMSAAKRRAAITAYPAEEAGGVVWVYMGPPTAKPALPQFEWMQLPPEHVHVSRWLQRSNFMQGVEGEIDTSHISFLHKEFDVERPQHGNVSVSIAGADGAPEITLKETPYGFTYGARRPMAEGQYWRVTQWMVPMYSLVPRHTTEEFTYGGGRAWVPVDDDNVMTFGISFRVDAPFTPEDLEQFTSGRGFPPRLTRGSIQLEQGQRIDTFLPVANASNDYLVDRAAQKTVNFTGIWGANEQDRALQESMPRSTLGRTVDRTREQLVSSDVAIVAARRRLLKLARELQDGVEPSAHVNGEMYRVRALSRICDVPDFATFLEKYGARMAVPPAPR